MIIISYDIESSKKRAHFAKYIKRFGHRLQYSVYMIDNGERMLNNIITDIKNIWEKEFDQCDSVYIFVLSGTCRVEKFGYAKNEDQDLLIAD